MKNRSLIFSIISFILGGGMVYLVMKNNKNPSPHVINHPNDSTENVHLEKIEKLFSGLKPLVKIPHDTAQQLVLNYVPPAIPDRQNPDGTITTGNTQAIWFDITSLAELIDEVTQLPQGDGVRVYFGKYGSGYRGIDSRGVKQNYSNATTLVLVPTVTSTNGVVVHHVDFGGTATIPADYENKGEVCPPPSNCFTIGATLLPAPPPGPAPSLKKKE